MFDSQRLRTLFNQTDPVVGLGEELERKASVRKCIYDFSTMGGAVSSIPLVDDQGEPAKFPEGSIIVRSFMNVVTAVTSGGAATVAFTLVNSGDVLAATAKTSFTLNAMLDGIQDGAAANMIAPLTSAKVLNITIAAAALTAGKIEVFVEYVN